MSAAVPLPIGSQRPIEVSIGELGGKVFTLRRVNGRSLTAFRAWQANTQDYALAWSAARACVPDLSDEEAELLSIDSVLKIVELASGSLEAVEAALSKGAGPAAAPAASSSSA